MDAVSWNLATATGMVLVMMIVTVAAWHTSHVTGPALARLTCAQGTLEVDVLTRGLETTGLSCLRLLQTATAATARRMTCIMIQGIAA